MTRFVYFVGGGLMDLTIKAVPHFDTYYAFQHVVKLDFASLESKVAQMPLEIAEDRYAVIGRTRRHPNGGEYVVAVFIHEQGTL